MRTSDVSKSTLVRKAGVLAGTWSPGTLDESFSLDELAKLSRIIPVLEDEQEMGVSGVPVLRQVVIAVGGVV